MVPLLVTVLVWVLAACGAVGLPSAPPPSVLPPPSSSVPAAGTSERARSDALRAAARASVRVRAVGCAGVETGSGFALDAHTLVTNAHVVAGAQQLKVDTWDGHQLSVSGSVTARVADLAVVSTREELPAAVPLAEVDPAGGAAVTVVGYPRGEALARAAGTVTAVVEDPLGASAAGVLELEAQVAPGSSGSAVVDAGGAVVGVVYAGSTTGEHAYAVPVSVLRAALGRTGDPPPPSRCP